MPLSPTRSVLRALLSGLVLSACGGMPDEAGLAPAEEPVGTQESAMCSEMSVTGLTVSGMDLYDGVIAGGGTWKVSPNTNSVYMEYFLDNNPKPTQQWLPGTYDPATGTTSGTWSYSIGGVSCGSHTVVIKAYPRHLSSNGAEEICPTPMTLTRTVYQACPPPLTDSLSCTQSSLTHVTCKGSAGGGSGSYPTRFWNYQVVSPLGPNFSTGWHQTGSTNPTGTNSWTYQIACKYTGNGYYDPAGRPPEKLTISFKVMDSTYKMSPASMSATFYCVPGTYFN